MTGRGWEPDELGAAFERRTIDLGADDEGPVAATLVRHRHPQGHRRGPLAGVDALYVHGWSDYFFQAELAGRVATLGARFWALDLRKYGRSLREGQTPGYVDDLGAYDAELDAAVRIIADERGHAPRLLPIGHSTGGLTLSLWAARRPGAVGVLLNSPWLEFQATAAGRAAIAPLLRGHARLAPLGPMPSVDPGFYARTVSDRLGGSWSYREEWRPEHGFPLHPGWLSAVLRGQATLARGVDVAAPALVVLSDRSLLGPRWRSDMAGADVALNVEAVAHRSLSLGREVTVARVPGALHDVFLSVAEPRERAYRVVERWARSVGR